MAWGYLGFAQLKLQHNREAVRAFHTAAGKSTLKVNYLACEAFALSRLHDRSAAIRMLGVMQARQQHRRWVPAECMVLIYLALGQRTMATDWLRRGAEDHTTTLFEVSTDPVYSELHTSARFRELYIKLGGRI